MGKFINSNTGKKNMRLTILTILFMVTGFSAFAQIGLGTTTPEAAVDVVSTDSGVLLPRVANTAAVTAPVNGMIVYDVYSECFRSYENNAWSGCGFTIPTETSPTGKVWMARNLGASRVAASSTDTASYGDLYQWGRGGDGHQLRTSTTTTTVAVGSDPGHGSFILGSSDWLATHDDTLWQGVNGVNNPCPKGYRVPTEAEWDAERLNWDTNDAAGAYGSKLKLPVAGRRNSENGFIQTPGVNGYYWSSTVGGDGSPADAKFFVITGSDANFYSLDRASGFSIRCIKN